MADGKAGMESQINPQSETLTTTRGHGGGTVYQRSSDGLWIAAVDWRRDRGGKRRRTCLTAKTRRGAEARLAAFLAANPITHESIIPTRAAAMEHARSIATHTATEWWAKVRAEGRRCTYCGVETTIFTMERDHDVPVARGGSDGIDNVVLSCRKCNGEKKLMTGDEYRAWRAAQR